MVESECSIYYIVEFLPNSIRISTIQNFTRVTRPNRCSDTKFLTEYRGFREYDINVVEECILGSDQQALSSEKDNRTAQSTCCGSYQTCPVCNTLSSDTQELHNNHTIIRTKKTPISTSSSTIHYCSIQI